MFDKGVFWLIIFNNSYERKVVSINTRQINIIFCFCMTKEHSNNTGFYYFIQKSKRTS